MAEDKKPPQKPTQKKTAGKAAGKKTTAQKTTAQKAAPNARARKASRPPIIDLKAEEVSPASDKKAEEKSAEPTKTKDQTSQDQKDKPQNTGDTPSAEKAESKKDAKLPPEDKPKKGSSLAAGGIGLVAGVVGGLLAGFIYANTQTDALPPPALTALESRVQDIEKAGGASKPDTSLLTRLDKAESDTRFLNNQLDTLSKDISKLKEQLTVFSGKFTSENDGIETQAPAAPIVDLSSIEGKITALEAQMSARAKSASEMTAKLQALQKEIAAERAALSEAGAKQSQSYQALSKSVDEKIANLYQAGGDNRIRAAALSLSIGRLAQAAKTNLPFPDQLNAVSGLLEKNDLIATLQPLAETGVPDIAALNTSFSKIKLDEAPQEAAPAGESSLVQKLISNASSVVKVSKVGEKASATATPIDKLKAHLKAGDLASVMTVSKSLAPQTSEKLQSWLAQVESRLTLDEAMAKLQSVVLAEIGKASGGGEQAPSAAPDKTEVKNSPESNNAGAPKPQNAPENNELEKDTQ